MMKKKLGMGSLSLLLTVLALFWSSNIRDFCFGDFVLNTLGLPTWSGGNTGMHYTVFWGLVAYIPAFTLGRKYSQHLFAQSGKWISGCLTLYLTVMGCAIMIWGI